MPRKKPNRHYRAARLALAALVPLALGIAGWQWLQDHPEHNPWAPLNLSDPPGWATRAKLARLKGDVSECRAVLERSDIAFTTLQPTGEAPCARTDRTRLGDYPLAPDTPPVTCPVAAALEIWRRDSVAPAARQIMGSEIQRMEHLGAYSCRRMYGDSEGPWSEHATANAIDIAGFVLEDGTRISVLKDWKGDGPKARFLRAVREGACGSFATVLSPDYNAAHADHFHLDQDDRWAGVCR
ncbi:extensin family protein [Erythrobacter oryzae]|uniref:extensin-like domain-containing protein n=1 Tax=Erythrobacter oryzae TaxID=3019556 RepID=UPI0025550999|nr:extensin family protein [Erythrobacter sp. COR-2]